MTGIVTLRTIHIEYYASLREQRGLGRESVRSGAQTPEALYRELQLRYGLNLPVRALRVAVNDEFSDWGAMLHEGDRVVFIQPVAGG